WRPLFACQFLQVPRGFILDGKSDHGVMSPVHRTVQLWGQVVSVTPRVATVGTRILAVATIMMEGMIRFRASTPMTTTAAAPAHITISGTARRSSKGNQRRIDDQFVQRSGPRGCRHPNNSTEIRRRRAGMGSPHNVRA